MKTIFKCLVVTLLMTAFASAKMKSDKDAVNNKLREDDTAAVVAAKQAEDEKKDCPCKCDEKVDKGWLQCLSGKYNGIEEERTVLNMCQYGCWKCRFNYMQHVHYGYCKDHGSYESCIDQLRCWKDGYVYLCMETPYESKTVNNICYAYCTTKHLDAKLQ